MPVDRRTVLRSGLLAAGSTLVAGCGDRTAARSSSPQPSAPRSSVPATPSAGPSNPPPAGGRSNTRGTAVEVRHGDRTRRTVALTFHGSGDPALARRLLDQVEHAGVKVTVLAVGSWLDAHPDLAGRILQGGHDLGNHTMHHRPMRTLGAAEVGREIRDCATVLRRTAGSAGRWFRASGTQETTPVIRSAAAAAGYDVCVSYDVDGLDWQDPPAATVRQAVLDNVKPGSIVSLHLGHPVTVAALPAILDGLTTRRLTPVTLAGLLG